MSIAYGFYNSKNGDKKYTADQMSRLFDGIINDGVFMSIGSKLMVKATSGMVVHVGDGRAWFNHTWTLNSSVLPLTLDLSEVVLNRIDAVVLEVNATESVRANTIKIVKGIPATNPAKPAMISSELINQHPLAYISVKAGVTEIVQADITNTIGTTECPFVTAILQTTNIDDLVAQWESEWDIWTTNSQSDFNAWFNSMKDQLSTDAAGNLQTEINGLAVDIESASKTAEWEKIEGKPNSYPPASHTHDYLPTAGGTLTGSIIFSDPMGTTTHAQIIQYGGSTYLRNVVDENNYKDIYLHNDTDPLYIVVTGGVPKNYRIYGEHNVTVSTAAPISVLPDGYIHMVY